MIAMALSLFLASVAVGAAPDTASFRAIKIGQPAAQLSWSILDRDGAGRQVEPYLSSLAAGEQGTGAAVSPRFSVASDSIAFTLCGHDGAGGGRKANWIALLDAKSGERLLVTYAPGSDPLRELSWDTAKLKGREVRIELHDGIAADAYAWVGVGKIEAGPGFSVDFRTGLPAGWEITALKVPTSAPALLENGIPFLRTRAYTIIPSSGVAEVPCGFVAGQLFFLGCTAAAGKPSDVCGEIEIIYRGRPAERFPLTIGSTLELELKLLSSSPAMRIRPSGDPFQYYLAVTPRREPIEKIRLVRRAGAPATPRITAITCRTTARAETLEELPLGRLSDDDEAWIRSHALSAGM